MDAPAFLETYRTALAKQVGTVKFFLQDNNRQLTEAFVELTVIEDYRPPENPAQKAFLGLLDAGFRERRELLKEKEPEEGEDEKGKKEPEPQNRILKPDELLQPKTHAVVVGAPGCGKTTLLRYLANKTRIESKRLPVFLELKKIKPEFLENVRKLHELVFEQGVLQYFDLGQCEKDELKTCFNNLLKNGEVSIFLDGFDEILDQNVMADLGNLIDDFVHPSSHFAGNNLIVSTRPYAFVKLGQLAGAKAYEITPLNLRKIEHFISHLFDADKAKATQLVKIIRENSQLQEMAGTPLLLCVLADLFRQGKDLLQSRTELYDKIVRTLVIKYEDFKRVNRFAIPDKYGVIKRKFLTDLAFERVFQPGNPPLASRLIFSIEEIEKAACQFPGGYNSNDLMSDVIATPLLREVGRDTYAFAHLTILEYLVAVKLAELEDNDSEFKRYFRQAYFNRTLVEMEILPMTLGLVSKPNEVYDWLETLPDSINLAGLRLRARGLAFVQNLNQKHLSKLTCRLKSLILETNQLELPYFQPVARSFTGANLQSAHPISIELVKWLQAENSSPSFRCATTVLLGHLGDSSKEVMAELFKLLCDEDAHVSGKAFEVVVNLGQGNETLVNELLNLLQDKDLKIQLQATRALGELGTGSKKVTNRLLELMEIGNSDVRQYATDAIVKLGTGNEDIANGLLKLLEGQSLWVSLSAASALTKLGEKTDEVEKELLEMMQSRSFLVRERTAYRVGSFKIRTAKIVRKLLELLRDENGDVRESAVTTLGDLGVKDDEVVSRLLELLKDWEQKVRARAAKALGSLGVGKNEVISGLLHSLEDKDLDEVRQSSAWALGMLGIRTEDVISGLFELMKDGSPNVRLSAANALVNLGDQSVEVLDELLRLMQEEKDVHTAILASMTLEQLGKGNTAILEGLLGLLKAKSPYTTIQMLANLGENSPEVVIELMNLLQNEDRFTRIYTAQALVKLGNKSEQVIEELQRFLKDDSLTLRGMAAGELCNLGLNDPRVMTQLILNFIQFGGFHFHLARMFDRASDEILAEALQLAAKSEDPQVSQKAKEWLRYYNPDGNLEPEPKPKKSTISRRRNSIISGAKPKSKPKSKKGVVMPTVIRLLHLSDFHFTADPKDGGSPVKAANRDAVNSSLLEQIEKLVKDGQTYDLIVITGDIAFGGKKEEYTVAADFCKNLLVTTGLSADRLFVVPGNHDVIRDQVKKTHLKWYAFSKLEEVSDILNDDDYFPILMRKFANYREFANSVMNRKLYDESKYFYVEKVSLQKSGTTVGINILGLNSVLFCGYDGDDNQKLVFGRPQIDATLRDRDKNAALSVALFHHPFHDPHMPCYNPVNAEAENRLTHAADLILTGHLHTPKNSFVQTGAGAAIHIQAGASFESRDSQNAFDVIELDLATGKGQVQFYKYLSSDHIWIKNNEVNPHHENGVFHFEIKRLAEKPVVTPTSESIPPAPKVEAPKAEAPAIPQKPADRTELLDILIRLTRVQFNLLVTYLNVRPGHLPGKDVEQGERAIALIEYAEAPGGCGLDQIKHALDRVIKQ